MSIIGDDFRRIKLIALEFKGRIDVAESLLFNTVNFELAETQQW